MCRAQEIKMENQVADTVVEEAIDYKALYEKASEDLQKVVAKKDELLSETKKAKQEKAEQIAAAQRAEQEKAQKDGEFEKLWQSAEERRKQLEQELQNERNSYRQEKIQTHAMRVAVELADGDALSAKLLSHFLQDKLSKIATETGTLDDSVIDAVKQEFKNNKDFAPLLSGSKANGGGALGSGNSVATANTIDRNTFNQMDAGQQRDFVVKHRGTITD
jgi:hypothetical protein